MELSKQYFYAKIEDFVSTNKLTLDIFTKAEKDFVKILDLGYIMRTHNNSAFYIKVEGSRDINIDLYCIDIATDFGLYFNGLELNRRYSIAELKEMMNELS